MEACDGEWGCGKDACKGLYRCVLATVPGWGEDGPLQFAVSAREGPKEVVARISATERKGVHLHIARIGFAGQDGFA